MQDVFSVFELQRMSGIGAALETGDELISGGEHIHDLALAFVAPLQPKQHVSLVGLLHDPLFKFST